MQRDDDAWLHRPQPAWPPEGQPGDHARQGGSRPVPPLPPYRHQPPLPPMGHQPSHQRSLTSRLTEQKVVASAATLGLGALAGLAAYAFMGPTKPQAVRQTDIPRLPDDAPGRTAKQASFGDYRVVGRSVTIDRPRAEIYAFWRDFRNLSKFMENIADAREVEPGISTWTIRAPLGMTMQVKSRIVNDREGEQIAWRSTPDSQIETEGKVTFRDAPAGRGTIVEAHVAYKPPMGALGQAVGKLFSAEPSVQSRRDLKRLKMLMETGEIATNQNQTGKGGKFQRFVKRDLQQSVTAV